MAETSGRRKADGDLDTTRLLKKRTLILGEEPSTSSEEESDEREEPKTTEKKETQLEANLDGMCAAESQAESP